MSQVLLDSWPRTRSQDAAAKGWFRYYNILRDVCEVWWLEFPTICPCLKRAAYIDMPSPGRPRRDRAYSQVCRTPGGWDYSCGNVGGYQQ